MKRMISDEQLQAIVRGESGSQSSTELIRSIADELLRSRRRILVPLTEAEVAAALHKGHAERRAAEGDNAWTSLLADRDRLCAALLEACGIADRAYRSMCAVARSPDHWPGTSERIAELSKLAGGAP